MLVAPAPRMLTVDSDRRSDVPVFTPNVHPCLDSLLLQRCFTTVRSFTRDRPGPGHHGLVSLLSPSFMWDRQLSAENERCGNYPEGIGTDDTFTAATTTQESAKVMLPSRQLTTQRRTQEHGHDEPDPLTPSADSSKC